MSVSWLDAARRYAAHNTELRMSAAEFENMARILVALRGFSDSRAGIESRFLLKASGKLIEIKRDSEFLYGWGELGATRILIRPSVLFLPRLLPAKLIDLSKFLAQAGRCHDQVVPWLQKELDVIANGAPQEFV